MTTIVYEGDRVIDPLDFNRVRTVQSVDGNTVYMTDGGVMGLDEIDEVCLPSEDISDFINHS